MSQPSVYVSILNWNSAERTIHCLESLQGQTYSNVRHFVVDNASRDGSVATIRAAFPHVDLIAAGENLGYAGGHELAARRALDDQADLLWILNNDVHVLPDTLSKLVAAYQEHPHAIFGGVPLLPSSANLDDRIVSIHRKFLEANYREALFDLKPGRPFRELFPDRHPRPVAALSGSCLLLPLDIVREHGFIDTTYFLYSEEVDYCFRLRLRGVPSIIVPEAILLHEHEGSTRAHTTLKDIVVYYRLRNQLVRIARYQGAFTLLGALVKDLLLILGYPLLRGRAGLHTSYFAALAVRDGLQGRLGKTFAPEDYLR